MTDTLTWLMKAVEVCFGRAARAQVPATANLSDCVVADIVRVCSHKLVSKGVR